MLEAFDVDHRQAIEGRLETERVEKVLFICTANICRSPMAEAILDALAKDGGLSFQVESAGTAALVGKPMAPNAVVALEELGIHHEDHQARQVDRAMLAEAELVLAMGPQHVTALRRLCDGLACEIYTLPEYATGVSSDETISDPYGLTISAYRSSVRQLLRYIEQTVNRLNG